MTLSALPSRPFLSGGPLPPASLSCEIALANPDPSQALWIPLRGGRVNQVWQVGDWVVKLYDPAASSPLFPNGSAAEAAALTHFAPSGLCPDLLAKGPDWIAYRHIAGPTWTDGVQSVATMLGKLHALPLPPRTGFRELPSGSAAILNQGQGILAACQARLPAPPRLHIPPNRHPCALHGDAVPGNIIMSAQGPLLIDWQCPAIGDPAEDLATFLSPAMQFLYRGKVLTKSETETFLKAYPDPATVARYGALAPLFHWRMAAHCLWKAERGHADYGQAMQFELAELQP